MIKIRLLRGGVKKRPFYKIIVNKNNTSKNGIFIEKLGFFNPISSKKINHLKIQLNRIDYWINLGAKISKSVKYLIKQYNYYK